MLPSVVLRWSVPVVKMFDGAGGPLSSTTGGVSVKTVTLVALASEAGVVLMLASCRCARAVAAAVSKLTSFAMVLKVSTHCWT